MTIVVGYTPTPAGRAALSTATTEARKSDRPLVVVNSSRGDALDDPAFAQPADLERRRSAVGKMVFGSNAHRILMDSPCPVLTVRAA